MVDRTPELPRKFNRRVATMGLVGGGALVSIPASGIILLRPRTFIDAALGEVPLNDDEKNLALYQTRLDAAKDPISDVTPEQSYAARAKIISAGENINKRAEARKVLIEQDKKLHPLRTSLEQTASIGGAASVILGMIVEYLAIQRERAMEKRRDLQDMLTRLERQPTS